MKSLVVGLLGTVLIAGAANAVECSDLPQDVMDKILIDAEKSIPDDMGRREHFIDVAVRAAKIAIATKEAQRRRQQQQQPQAK
jgi:hypothetical protein